MRPLLRLVAYAATLQLLSQSVASLAGTVDGFVASCTGNLDGTGECVNAETGGKYSCLIIPGQVIDCKSRSSRSFQCVWISGAQANYAEFWCDPQVDAMLQNELSSQQLNQPFSDTTTNQLRPLQQNELKDSFQDTDGGWLKQEFRDPLNPMLLDPTANPTTNPTADPTPATKTPEN
jgi:hypothetical protein